MDGLMKLKDIIKVPFHHVLISKSSILISFLVSLIVPILITIILLFINHEKKDKTVEKKI